ncbi:MAG: glutamate synthase, partial [Oscillospiraceae bacterium]|nr:glutamate synthase [Oscillospiraceae bacterium]
CTGMHGGRLYARGTCEDILFPPQVSKRPAEGEELEEIRRYVSEYCARFGGSVEEIMDSPFTIVTPDTSNPYKQLYVAN